MGQQLPLPERVPFPDQRSLPGAMSMGIVFSGVDANGYSKMTLPPGWQFAEESCDWTMPDWVVVDDKMQIRARVWGRCGLCIAPEAWFMLLEPSPFTPKAGQRVVLFCHHGVGGDSDQK